jgi:oxygen-independent coproporphyrinogen III oxidase
LNKIKNNLPGIYIHIPFCRQACHYCNFHFSTSLSQKTAMVDAICKEIALSVPFSSGETINTIYFGGGTPSLLNIAELNSILQAVRQKFTVSTLAEITLEANPDDIDAAVLSSWQQLGINRLSIGIQSFLPEELSWMNRAHTATQAKDCIRLARSAGFDNFSVDLIYGSPLLNDDDWKRNVDWMIACDVPHISCYALTVEPSTALHKMIDLKKKAPVDAERQATQLLLLMNWLPDAGYEHYEISNFARPGMRSRHNSSYWQGVPYYGFGPSAHSYNGSSRQWNTANNAQFLQALAQGHIPFEAELLTNKQQLNEYIMISLRTMEGLDIELVEKNFGQKEADRIRILAKKYSDAGKLITASNKLILTNEGKLLADGIAADLFA